MTRQNALDTGPISLIRKKIGAQAIATIPNSRRTRALPSVAYADLPATSDDMVQVSFGRQRDAASASLMQFEGDGGEVFGG